MTSAPGFESGHCSSLSTLALLTRFLTASFEDGEGPTYMIRLVSGDNYDLSKDYQEHASLIEALKQGKPLAVRQAFAAITEVFHVQDVENLRVSEAEHRTEAGRKRPIMTVR